METSTLRTNGVELRVLTAGPADGPPVLLLHGFPDLPEGWTPQIRALAGAGYRVMAPSQRGYPGSTKPNGVEAYRVSALAADVLGLLAASGYDRVHLVGHDWGGIVGFYLATDYPERLWSYTAMNIPHPRVYARSVRGGAQTLRSWYVLAFQVPGVERLLMAGDGAAIRTALAVGRTRAWERAELDHYVEAFREPGAMRAMLNWYRAALRTPDLPQGRRVKVPTLLVWGTQDPALSFQMVDPTAALCDDVTVRVFRSAGHWVQHDATDEVNAALLSHLALNAAARERA